MRGGKRKGAGRKHLYGEETVQLSTSVPKSKKQEIKDKIHDEILCNYIVTNKEEKNN